jgi:hypothetical protein
MGGSESSGIIDTLGDVYLPSFLPQKLILVSRLWLLCFADCAKKNASRDVAVGVHAKACGIGSKKRVFNLDLTHCPHCGGQLRIVAAILQRQAIVKILITLG